MSTKRTIAAELRHIAITHVMSHPESSERTRLGEAIGLQPDSIRKMFTAPVWDLELAIEIVDALGLDVTVNVGKASEKDEPRAGNGLSKTQWDTLVDAIAHSSTASTILPIVGRFLDEERAETERVKQQRDHEREQRWIEHNWRVQSERLREDPAPKVERVRALILDVDNHEHFDSGTSEGHVSVSALTKALGED
jgi:hypothetical protein